MIADRFSRSDIFCIIFSFISFTFPLLNLFLNFICQFYIDCTTLKEKIKNSTIHEKEDNSRVLIVSRMMATFIVLFKVFIILAYFIKRKSVIRWFGSVRLVRFAINDTINGISINLVAIVILKVYSVAIPAYILSILCLFSYVSQFDINFNRHIVRCLFTY